MTEDNENLTIIAAYTRKQALEDGEQVEVTETATEAGIRYRVFLTRSVYDTYVIVPPWVCGQDEAGRLWDILWMTRLALRSVHGNACTVRLSVRSDNKRPRPVTLMAVCGPVDIDNPQPAITIMMPDED